MDAKALQTALDVLGADASGIAVYSRAILQTPVAPRCCAGACRTTRPKPRASCSRCCASSTPQGVRLIWVETPPDGPEWEGVRDRLQRAVGGLSAAAGPR